MANSVSRQVAGTVMRTTAKWIRQANLTERVQARIGSEPAAMLNRPPLPISWVPAAVLDELLDAVEQETSARLLVTYGLEAARSTLGVGGNPLIGAMRAMYGASPNVLFGRMGTLTELLFRGVGFEWKPDGRNCGVLTVRTPDLPKVAWFRAWEGFIQFVFELSGVDGAPMEWTLMPDGRTAYYAMAWWERPSHGAAAR